ncbi:MAG: glycoside hydrolase family 97 catalytic domain-containing protein [Sphingomonas bacterium]
MPGLFLVIIALAGCSSKTTRPRDYNAIVSPDGRTAIGSSVNGAGRLVIAIRHGASLLVAASPVGLDLADHPFGPMEMTRRTDAVASNGCGASSITARERGGLRRSIRLETRACNGGAAFRLVIPPQSGLTQVRLAGESTRFVLPRNDLCLGARHTRYFNSHESDYAPTRLRSIAPGDLYDLPLTCVTGHGGEAYALTESGIEHYSAAYLTGTKDGASIAIRLTPRPDNDALAVKLPMPPQGLTTPWRVVMVADRPEQLIANDLVWRLASPSRIGDSGWVQPGKAAWGWWSGLLAPDVPNAGHNMPTYKRYIDFAARLGLPYYVIDEGWAPKPRKDRPADVMHSADGIDVHALAAYARQRGVRLWLWADWKSLDGKMEPVLQQWQNWGVAGMKIDFIYRQDQDVVDFYHELLASAARHRLLVNLHAAFVPRGLDRTYPNFLTQEGAMGNEYNRWSRKVTAGYNVRAAFSRATIGPMDYTPGGFRNVTPAEFNYGAPPEVMTTRAQQLALFVIYPSPLTVLADAPVAYRDGHGRWVPGVTFIREVPTIWDETQGIAGEFGQWIAVARRHAGRWYVGAITNEHARKVSLPLAFLGAGQWKVRAWADGKSPSDIDRREGTITGRTNLILQLAPSGGAALIFSQ